MTCWTGRVWTMYEKEGSCRYGARTWQILPIFISLIVRVQNPSAPQALKGSERVQLNNHFLFQQVVNLIEGRAAGLLAHHQHLSRDAQRDLVGSLSAQVQADGSVHLRQALACNAIFEQFFEDTAHLARTADHANIGCATG